MKWKWKKYIEQQGKRWRYLQWLEQGKFHIFTGGIIPHKKKYWGRSSSIPNIFKIFLKVSISSWAHRVVLCGKKTGPAFRKYVFWPWYCLLLNFCDLEQFGPNLWTALLSTEGMNMMLSPSSSLVILCAAYASSPIFRALLIQCGTGLQKYLIIGFQSIHCFVNEKPFKFYFILF